MRLRNIAAVASIVFLVRYLLKEKGKGQVRVKRMAISLDLLKRIIEEPGFQELVFHHEYDNLFLARDRVFLTAFVGYNNGQPMKKENLEVVNDGELFPNEQGYSVYRLTKNNIVTIINSCNGGAAVSCFLLKPAPYEKDERYLSYKIIPADKDRKPVRVVRHVQMQQYALSSTEGETMEEGAAFQQTETSAKDEMEMQPSPPAGYSME